MGGVVVPDPGSAGPPGGSESHGDGGKRRETRKGGRAAGLELAARGRRKGAKAGRMLPPSDMGGLRRHVSSLVISTGAFDADADGAGAGLAAQHGGDENCHGDANRAHGQHIWSHPAPGLVHGQALHAGQARGRVLHHPKLKRCKSASLAWEDAAWGGDMLMHNAPESEEEKALSSQVINLLESPREAKERDSDDFSGSMAEPEGEAASDESGAHPRLMRRATFSIFPKEVFEDLGEQPANVESPSSEHSPEWTSYPESESQEGAAGDAEAGAAARDQDAQGSRPKPVLRRVNSAELVRRAFPEMLFDRVASPGSAADHELDMLKPRKDGSEGEHSHQSSAPPAPTPVQPVSPMSQPAPEISPMHQHHQHHQQQQQQPAHMAHMYGVPQQAMPAMQGQFMVYMQHMMFAQQQAHMMPPIIAGPGMSSPPMMAHGYAAAAYPMYAPYMSPMAAPQQQQQQQMPPPPSQQQHGAMHMHGRQQQAARGPRRGGESSGWGASGNSAGSPHAAPMLVCSNLLAEHKHTGRKPTVAELRGHVLEFAKDSHGSRYLQEVMTLASPEERQGLIEEVKGDCLSVIQDLFGNYVMQNFLDHATEEQRDFIANKMRGVLVELSMHPHGCRVVQKALELIGPAEIRRELLKELILTPGNLELTARDAHATHVLQKAVVVLQRDVYPGLEKRVGRGERFKKRTAHAPHRARTPRGATDPAQVESSKVLLKAIEDIVAANVMALAVNQHACRLVQRVLGDCDRSRSPCVSVMMDALETDYDKLARDQHGNFILQHILELGQQEQANRIQNYVSARVVELSQHKFGSHLVEKCLVTSTAKQAVVIIDALLSSPFDTLTKMMKDPYANFVLQRAYDVCQAKHRARIEQEVSTRADLLAQYTHGRHILSHLARSKHNHARASG